MNKDDSASRPIAVDLFAGAGGMSLGFERAGFDVVAAVEIDPVHCAVHEFKLHAMANLRVLLLASMRHHGMFGRGVYPIQPF